MSTFEPRDGSGEPTVAANTGQQACHEPRDDGSLSVTVVDALGEALDADATTVDPLYHSIDPDALDSLFVGRTDPAAAELTFVHEGCSVTVRGDGEVRATVLDE